MNLDAGDMVEAIRISSDAAIATAEMKMPSALAIGC